MARYSEEARRAGELSAPEAAAVLGLTPTTLCRWAREALEGGHSKVDRDHVRRDVAGRYWFDAQAIERLKECE